MKWRRIVIRLFVNLCLDTPGLCMMKIGLKSSAKLLVIGLILRLILLLMILIPRTTMLVLLELELELEMELLLLAQIGLLLIVNFYFIVKELGREIKPSTCTIATKLNLFDGL